MIRKATLKMKKRKMKNAQMKISKKIHLKHPAQMDVPLTKIEL